MTYEYNNLGELTKVPGLIDEAPRYDEGGFLVGVTVTNQIATTYEYDRNGRLTILNWDGIENAVKNPHIGCSAEGHVSHILAARLYSRPMALSLQGAEKEATGASVGGWEDSSAN